MNTPNPHHARFDRRASKPTMHPRRVVGGIRMLSRLAPAAAGVESPAAPTESKAAAGWTWASARWMRLAESHAPGDQLAEGLEYAQAGQTRSLEIKPGAISARVQGRMPAAYKTALRLPTFDHDQWERVIVAMTQQARYAAAILSGELPPNIEDLFAPHGLKLFPTDAPDLSPSCTCSVFTGIEPLGISAPGDPAPKPPVASTPWCKHVCCLMYLTAERIGQNPLLIMALRGMAEADLVERLRQARALAGMQRSAGAIGAGPGGTGPGGGFAPVYAPHVPITDRCDQPLADCLHSFWTAPEPDSLAQLDCPIGPPEVSHPLLRRLGPSPFTGAKFPLVGLLATCYDVISAGAIEGAEQPGIAADQPGAM